MKIQNIKLLLPLIWACASPLTQAQSSPILNEQEIVGEYFVSGSPDVLERLNISADHRFEWALMAGSLDAYEKGVWQLDSLGVLTLTSDPVDKVPFFKQDEELGESREEILSDCSNGACKVEYPSHFPFEVQLIGDDPDIDLKTAKIELDLDDDKKRIQQVDENYATVFEAEPSEATKRSAIYGVKIQANYKGEAKSQNFQVGTLGKKVVYRFQVADPRPFTFSQMSLMAQRKDLRLKGLVAQENEMGHAHVFTKIDNLVRNK